MDGAKRIIISPSGPLWELPFAALVMNSSGEPEWLGLERRLSYTPSLTVLAGTGEAEPRPAEPKRHALVVGDPQFVRASVPAAMGAIESAILRGERFYLAPKGAVPARLPATAVEARRVAALYDVQPLLGEAATEAAVREKLTHASVVHLATHGYFNPQLAMSSGILLAPPAGEIAIHATDDDGALQAWEFGTSLPLQANLVVLSACETGLGETARGEGLVGLTRALQAAGARSVVATHWKVADEATADLMVTLHKHLRKGAATDEALRQAMRKIAERKRTRHPFYWAAFLLTGDPDRPVYLSE
jgi:CHAT domain-containing protein